MKDPDVGSEYLISELMLAPSVKAQARDFLTSRKCKDPQVVVVYSAGDLEAIDGKDTIFFLDHAREKRVALVTVKPETGAVSVTYNSDWA